MTHIPNPSWLACTTLKEAQRAQKEMAECVVLKDDFVHPLTYIGGMDVSNTPFDPRQMIFTAAVVCSYPVLSIVQIATYAMEQTFTYIPGFLGFREVPALIEAFKQLTVLPDLIMVDGHGVSHPRGLGIASHLGVLLDIPTIGVAKSILVGKPARTLSQEPGSRVPLVYKGKEVAMMVRSKKRCLPLIISAGHKISLSTATEIVMQCLRNYRLPEPTRYAHCAANEYRKQQQQNVDK